MVATMTNTPLTDEKIVQFRLHNATVPLISRLPHELLSAIFVFAVPFLLTDNTVVDALFALSRVCSNWRDIAIQTPILWVGALKYLMENLDLIYYGKLTDRVISMMDLWATRAQGLPICWNINVMDDLPNHPLLPFLDKHKHHVGELIIHSDVLSAAQILTHVTQPMPLLESLSLFSVRRGGTIRLSLPPDLFGHDAPNLKKMELRNVNLPSPDLTATTFFNIRHLNMTFDDNPVRDITVSRVLGLLAAMPNLEEIIFSFRILPDGLSDQPRSLKAVVLKNLRFFSLDLVDCRIFISFMKALSLPSLERLYLDIDLNYEDARIGSDILRVLCQHLLEQYSGTPLFTHPFEYIHISDSFRDPTVTVKVGSVPENKDPIELIIVAWFPQYIVPHPIYTDFGHALRDICCSLPLDQARTLVIEAGGLYILPYEYNRDDNAVRAWSEVCAGMKSIEVAKVENVTGPCPDSEFLHSAILEIFGLEEN